MDVEEYAGTQIRDWQLTTTKDKGKAPTIPDSTRFEKINWVATQQEQQLAEILKELDEKVDLPDTEENEETSEVSTKLEKNMKEIQEHIDWRKNNSIIQIG